jgi:hypothetical protein
VSPEGSHGHVYDGGTQRGTLNADSRVDHEDPTTTNDRRIVTELAVEVLYRAEVI